MFILVITNKRKTYSEYVFEDCIRNTKTYSNTFIRIYFTRLSSTYYKTQPAAQLAQKHLCNTVYAYYTQTNPLNTADHDFIFPGVLNVLLNDNTHTVGCVPIYTRFGRITHTLRCQWSRALRLRLV